MFWLASSSCCNRSHALRSGACAPDGAAAHRTMFQNPFAPRGDQKIYAHFCDRPSNNRDAWAESKPLMLERNSRHPSSLSHHQTLEKKLSMFSSQMRPPNARHALPFLRILKQTGRKSCGFPLCELLPKTPLLFHASARKAPCCGAKITVTTCFPEKGTSPRYTQRKCHRSGAFA